MCAKINPKEALIRYGLDLIKPLSCLFAAWFICILS